MSSAIAVRSSGFGWDLSYEPVTTDSREIQRAWAHERNYLRGSASDWLPVVEAALRGIQADCAKANWDGSGACPVAVETISLAAEIAKTLFAILPRSTPAPDIIPEADGEICMSWSGSAYRLFSFSIGAHSRINYAGQFENSGSVHGWQPIDATTHDDLNESLQEIVRHIRRLYEHAATKRNFQ